MCCKRVNLQRIRKQRSFVVATWTLHLEEYYIEYYIWKQWCFRDNAIFGRSLLFSK